MNSHSRARTTPLSREELVERVQRQGWTVAEAAEGVSVSIRTSYKWLARAKREGRPGLADRRSVFVEQVVGIAGERLSRAKSKFDGAVKNGQLVTKRDGNIRFVHKCMANCHGRRAGQCK